MPDDGSLRLWTSCWPWSHDHSATRRFNLFKREQGSIVQDHVEQRAVDFEDAVVLDESELSKAVHEEIHPRSGRADHLREDFLADPGDHVLRLALLAEVSEQQQNARQALFAGVEELIDKVRLDPDIARQKKGDKHIGEGVLIVQ